MPSQVVQGHSMVRPGHAMVWPDHLVPVYATGFEILQGMSIVIMSDLHLAMTGEMVSMC